VWAEVGLAARLDERSRSRLAQRGLGMITPQQGMQILDRLLPGDNAQAVVLPVDWPAFLQQEKSALYSEMARVVDTHYEKTTGERAAPGILERLEAAPPNRRKPLLMAHVRDQAMKVLGLNPSHPLDPRRPLNELGLDSLMAVELRNALGAGLHRAWPATLLFDHPTLEALVDFLAEELLTIEPPPEPKSGGGGVLAQAVVELEKLSEDEAEALLLQELASSKRGR
jgi:hypothetical protein